MNNRQEFVNQWVQWLDSDIRHGVLAQWEKDNKRELKEFLEELQTDPYFEEIRLSRELAKAIGQEVESIPHSVMVAYTNLLKHYARDGERYRWLRNERPLQWVLRYWKGHWDSPLGADLDAAIDAAMKERT